MNKKILLFIILIILLTITSPIFMYISYNKKINEKVSLVRVPYANQQINENTKITSDMISFMNIPQKQVTNNSLKSLEDIIGKCTKNNSIIINGSIFYKDLLTNCNEE